MNDDKKDWSGQPCGVSGPFENCSKIEADLGHMPYLPNRAAQRATIHGMGDPTHRRSFGGILVSKLQNSWLHFLCGPTGPSVNYTVNFLRGNIGKIQSHDSPF